MANVDLPELDSVVLTKVQVESAIDNIDHCQKMLQNEIENKGQLNLDNASDK